MRNTISQKRQKLIDEYLSQPLKIGDKVEVRGLGIQNKTAWGNITSVKKILEDGSIEIEHHSSNKIVSKEDYRKYIHVIGENNFPKTKDKIQNLNFALESILDVVFKEDKYDEQGIPIKASNFNPFVYIDGVKKYYQRPLVWSIEDKQNLIESIYNNIDCGKILVRNRSWNEIRELVNKGETEVAWKDVIDGKQRLNAMWDFVNDIFPDKNGTYFGDMNREAQHRMISHQLFSYSELPENSDDKEVLLQFLKLNFAGVPQSIEHIEYVKSLL